MSRNRTEGITEEEQKAWNELLEQICAITDIDELNAFFDDMLTEKEIIDIADRYLLMEDLIKGKSQRDIALDRKMSLCKITRGSKMLKKQDGYMRRYLNEKYDDHTHL